MINRYICTLHVYCTYTAHILHGDDGVLLRGRLGEQTAFSELRALLSRSESATSAGNVVGALWYGMPSLWLRSRNSRLTGAEYGIAGWCGIWPEWRKSMSVPKGRPTQTQKPKPTPYPTPKTQNPTQNQKTHNNPQKQISKPKFKNSKFQNSKYKRKMTKAEEG